MFNLPIEIQNIILDFVESKSRIYFKKNVLKELNLFEGKHTIFLMQEFLDLLDNNKYHGLVKFKHDLKLQFAQEYYYWVYNKESYYLSDFEIYY
jgi:hypothetical protein